MNVISEVASSVLLVFLAAACQKHESAFWQEGGRYRLTLVARERPALVPGAVEYHQPVRDTLVLELTVDSIRRSTVYGSYSGNFRGFAIRVGSPATAAREFQAHLRGDTVRMELAPRVVDGRLLLSGLVRSDTISGEWATEAAPRTRGIFALRR